VLFRLRSGRRLRDRNGDQGAKAPGRRAIELAQARGQSVNNLLECRPGVRRFRIRFAQEHQSFRRQSECLHGMRGLRLSREARNWRIHAELAQRLIVQARKLYAGEDLGLDLTNTIYALDSTTIDLCLSAFPWAHFRTTKSALKMHTLVDSRGNIPSVIHVLDGKLADVHALDLLVPEGGAINPMDRGYVDFGRLNRLHQAGAFFVTRAKSNMKSRRLYSAPADRPAGIVCDQTIAMDGHHAKQNYPEPYGGSGSRTPKPARPWFS
jgi:hypothetical protein